MTDLLSDIYLWTKSLHIMAVISWMAGIFYLPRLMVHHVEQSKVGTEMDATFQLMQFKLFKVIMNPAMIVTWICGLMLVFTPGIVDWSDYWPWAKAACVIGMTWFHHWLGVRRKELAAGTNTRSGRTYRMMNEVPTVLMIVIVLSVVLKY